MGLSFRFWAGVAVAGVGVLVAVSPVLSVGYDAQFSDAHRWTMFGGVVVHTAGVLLAMRETGDSDGP